MPDFNAKMHQNRFPPQTPLGEFTALAGTGGEGTGHSTCLPPRFDNPGYGPVFTKFHIRAVFSDFVALQDFFCANHNRTTPCNGANFIDIFTQFIHPFLTP